MSTSAPIIPIRVSSDAVRVRHGITGVVAQYIQDLIRPDRRRLMASSH